MYPELVPSPGFRALYWMNLGAQSCLGPIFLWPNLQSYSLLHHLLPTAKTPPGTLAMVHHLPCLVLQADPVTSAQICLSCQDSVGFCPIRGGPVCIRMTPKSFNRKYSICLRPQKLRNNRTEGKKWFSTCEAAYLYSCSVLTSCCDCMTWKEKKIFHNTAAYQG